MQNKENELEMSIPKKFVIALICVLISGVAYALSIFIVESGPKPERRKPQAFVPSVKIKELVFEDKNIHFELNGTVEAAREIELKSELQGLIVKMNSNVEIGKTVKRNEILFELEKIDYENALAQKKSNYIQALKELELEEGRQALSKREWNLIELENEVSDKEKKLALRTPQLLAAKSKVHAAKSDLSLAEKNLKRTVIKSPFDAMVLSKNVELGSRVSTQESLLRLASASPYWVRVSLSYDKLKYLNFRSKDKPGSVVEVFYATQGSRYKGEVLRVLPTMTTNTRMAEVLVEVIVPLNNSREKEPLLLGSYVRVHIQGLELKNVVSIDREHLKDGKFLYLKNNEDKLNIVEVKALSDGRDKLLITSGLEKGQKLITSKLSVPVNGMSLSEIKQ